MNENENQGQDELNVGSPEEFFKLLAKAISEIQQIKIILDEKCFSPLLEAANQIRKIYPILSKVDFALAHTAMHLDRVLESQDSSDAPGQSQ